MVLARFEALFIAPPFLCAMLLAKVVPEPIFIRAKFIIAPPETAVLPENATFPEIVSVEAS